MPLPISELQKLHIDDPLIEIIAIDATNKGGEFFYITGNPPPAGQPAIMFKGKTVISLPMQTDGWEENVDGLLPTPTLTVSNINKDLFDIVQSTGDLVGAKVLRYLIFAKNLDNGSQPDSTKASEPATFVIERKTHHSDTHISWRCILPFELPNLTIPRRRILRSRGFIGAGKGQRL